MKKVILCVCTVVIVILAAVNLNLAFNSEVDTKLSLANIFSTAQNETGVNCSVCGGSIPDNCTCEGGAIACDGGGMGTCYHLIKYNSGSLLLPIWVCDCEANGDPSRSCTHIHIYFCSMPG